MRRKLRLGKWAGWEWSADWNVLPSAVILALGLSLGAAATMNLPIETAIIAGLLATGLHYIYDVLHNLGHALAARRTGYPMRGIHFFMILVGSIYPRDEPPLPGKIHIQRALGGPIMSLIVTIILGLLAILAWDGGGIGRFVTTVGFLSNLLIFTIGALIPPLRFGWFSNDGGTILTWWGK
jgi:Zn-dependent protease